MIARARSLLPLRFRRRETNNGRLDSGRLFSNVCFPDWLVGMKRNGAVVGLSLRLGLALKQYPGSESKFLQSQRAPTNPVARACARSAHVVAGGVDLRKLRGPSCVLGREGGLDTCSIDAFEGLGGACKHPLFSSRLLPRRPSNCPSATLIEAPLQLRGFALGRGLLSSQQRQMGWSYLPVAHKISSSFPLFNRGPPWRRVLVDQCGAGGALVDGIVEEREDVAPRQLLTGRHPLMNGWMDEWMDGWMVVPSRVKSGRPITDTI